MQNFLHRLCQPAVTDANQRRDKWTSPINMACPNQKDPSLPTLGKSMRPSLRRISFLFLVLRAPSHEQQDNGKGQARQDGSRLQSEDRPDK